MKKSTTLFILFLFIVLVSNAQTDTTGDVCIPYPVIKSIQTDLLVGDSAKALLTITSNEALLLKRQVFEQRNLVDNYKISEENLKKQIASLKEQVGIHTTMYNNVQKNFEELSKRHRRTKVKNTLIQIGGIIGGAILVGEVLHYRNLYIKSM